MLRLLHRDGTVEEVGHAVSAAMEDGVLVCRDAQGEIVKSYDKLEVTVYDLSEEQAGYAVEGQADAGEYSTDTNPQDGIVGPPFA